MPDLDDAYSRFISNLTLSEVVLVNVSAERRSRGPIADEGDNEEAAWEFTFQPQMSDDGREFTVRVASRAGTSTAFVSMEHQLQYKLIEPTTELSNETAGQFLAQSTIVTVAPYIRELTHSLGLRMQCDVPWLNIVGPQSLTPGESEEDTPAP